MLQTFYAQWPCGLVFKQLKKSAIKEKKPSEAVLKELFNTLYYTSSQTEEGQFIKITVTLLDYNSIEPMLNSSMTIGIFILLSLQFRFP